MNILHVYKTYYPYSDGGVERVIYDLTDSDEHSYRILSVSPDKIIKEHVVNGVPVLFMPRWFELASTPFFNFLDKRVKDLFQWADLIHYHFPWPYADLVNFFQGRPKRYIVTYHSDVVKQRYANFFYTPLKFLFLGDADFVIATSPNYADSSSTLQRLNNLEVIPLGLHEAFGKKVPPTERPRPYFFFVGVHRYYKGLDFLVRAAVQMNCDVVIAGEGPETIKLKNLANELKSRNTIFCGRISEDEKIGLLKGCVAFVLPSHLRSEAFGVCLLEAMSVGKPIITTNIQSGMRFVNVDGHTGFCVDPMSDLALREAMEALINDKSRAIEMGFAAHQRFLGVFTARLMRARYHELYSRVC